MIQSHLCNVREILGVSLKYIVPKYQRNFEWRREQAEEFWEDISTGSVFLGNLILDIHDQNKQEVYIIDGQQRITTLIIFLSACKYRTIELKDHDLASEIQRKITFVDDTSGKASSPKLIPSPSILDVFNKTIVNQEWDGNSFAIKNMKRQSNKLRPIYDYFSECVSNYNLATLSELLKKLYESTFVKIEIEDTQDAFSIFERTNARGMELNAGDLLKNYLFANINTRQIENDWDDIVNNSSGNILRMIKYFYVSQKGLVQKKLLFKKLKTYGESIGAEELLQKLNLFASYYSLIVESDPQKLLDWADDSKNQFFTKEYNRDALNRALDALTLFAITQAYPLIIKLLIVLGSIKDHDKKNKYSEKLLHFLNVLEKFHFINYAVSQQPGNQVEKYYADKCVIDINEGNFLSFIDNTIKELRDQKIVGKSTFEEKFLELSYTNDFHLIYYINDRLNNYGRKGGQYITIYNPDKKLIRKNYDIDHLISQNLDKYPFQSDLNIVQDILDNIGNLLVISKHTNGSIQNMHINDKLKCFEKLEIQNIPEALFLIKSWKHANWETSTNLKDNVEKRAIELSKRCYDEVWKI